MALSEWHLQILLGRFRSKVRSYQQVPEEHGWPALCDQDSVAYANSLRELEALLPVASLMLVISHARKSLASQHLEQMLAGLDMSRVSYKIEDDVIHQGVLHRSRSKLSTYVLPTKHFQPTPVLLPPRPYIQLVAEDQ
jgi:hypothetical protein